MRFQLSLTAIVSLEINLRQPRTQTNVIFVYLLDKDLGSCQRGHIVVNGSYLASLSGTARR